MHKFVIMKNNELFTYTNFEDIPLDFDHIIETFGTLDRNGDGLLDEVGRSVCTPSLPVGVCVCGTRGRATEKNTMMVASILDSAGMKQLSI